MIKHYCDICGYAINPQDAVMLDGAIRKLSGADEVCRACARAINTVDWSRVVRGKVLGCRRQMGDAQRAIAAPAAEEA